MTALDEAIRAADLDPADLQVFSDAGDETVYYLLTSGQAALDQWRQLRELVESSGYWPLIMGDESDIENLRWSFENTVHMPRELAAVDTVESRLPYSAHAVVALVSQYSEAPTEDEVYEDEEAPEADEIPSEDLETDDLDDSDETADLDEFDEDMPRGEWPEEVEKQTKVYATTNLSTGEYLPQVILGFVPTTESRQVPAYLRFTNRDYDMGPVEHCATLQSWEGIYGAEIVALTGSGTIEMLVSRPPEDREAALALAMEQFSYCADIVGQGTETVDALAAELLGSPFWYFWWD